MVASGIGQLSDLIEDGTNGLLCAPGDSAYLPVRSKGCASTRASHELGSEARRCRC